MPSYMFLIYEDVDQPNATSDEEWAVMMQAHTAWQEHVARSGSKVVDGAPLEPASTATSIRPGADGPIVTDGPFAETKEALGRLLRARVPRSGRRPRLGQGASRTKASRFDRSFPPPDRDDDGNTEPPANPTRDAHDAEPASAAAGPMG